MEFLTAILLGPTRSMSFEEAGIIITKYNLRLKFITILYSLLPILSMIAIFVLLFLILLKKAKNDKNSLFEKLLIVFALSLVYALLVNIINSFAGGLPEAADLTYIQHTYLQLVYIIVYIINIILAVIFDKTKKV